MKTRLLSFAILTAGLLLIGAPLRSQEKKGGDSDEPGPMHKLLTKRAGDYTIVTKMMIPGAPADESTGTAKCKSILGGRFLQQEVTGVMAGQKFTSVHVEGYNNITKKFESTWMYTGGTGMMHLVGTSDDGGKNIKYVGSFHKSPDMKETLYVDTKQVSDDQFEVVLYGKNPDEIGRAHV